MEEDHNFFAADVLTHNCVIIDDPVKNRKEANSPTYRQSVFEWYTSTLYTRLTPDGQILLTVTRWSEDDLAGRLLALAKSDPEADQWETLILPAVSEEPMASYDEREGPGRALWDERWGIDKLNTIRRTVGSRDWASLYQQRPAPDEGEIFKRHHWRYWQPRGASLPPVTVTMADSSVIEVEAVELPARFDDMAQSWDCTFKGEASSDYVVGQVWAKRGADFYLLDQVRGQWTFTETCDALKAQAAKWPMAYAKLVEDKANGTAVMDALRKTVSGLTPIEPQGGKQARAHATSPLYASGNVYIPEPGPDYPWVNDYQQEHYRFPRGANDDQVDCASQAINYLSTAGASVGDWLAAMDTL